MCTLQFSSGCPYRCEFCDIPGLYGRQPRLKTPQQITAELDAMCRQKGHPSTVYFVDDNFIGNRKATRDMLPHWVQWPFPRPHRRKVGRIIQFGSWYHIRRAVMPTSSVVLWRRRCRIGCGSHSSS
jgi:DNA repair photolyase